jgi:ABC-type glycerol-3-phosphate transport system permease component
MIVNGKRHSICLRIINTAILLLACVITLIPIAWYLSTSLKPYIKTIEYPPKWIPRPLTIENYTYVLFKSNSIKYIVNSLIVSCSAIVTTIVLASHVAYAAARYKFKAKQIMMFAILMTSMIPGICIITSLYVISVKLSLHDTYRILIIVFTAGQLPTQVWLLKGFFEKIPIELEESAKLDGVTTLGGFYRIVVPLSTPGLAASAVLIFVNVWNDWLISATMTISESMRLINVGLFDYIKDLGVDWGKFTAYSLISIIPILILFISVQKYFIQGLTAGATKG